jgi:putative nucleotidyltransferase with HDIG domain
MSIDQQARLTVRQLLPEVEDIGDSALREAVVDIWAKAWASSEWQQLTDCPKGTELPPSHTLVAHSRSVAQMSMSMCDVIRKQNRFEVNRDDVIAIALLHDVCKLHEFTKTPEGYDKSELGKKYQHGFLAAFWMQEAGLRADLVHAVIAHTPLSAVIPQTQEAIIVHYADFADTDSLLHDAGLPLFCKRK